MKTIRILMILLALVVLTGGLGHAQFKNLTSLSYNVSLPIGTTADFISPVQWRGVTFEARRFVDRQLSVGFLAGWQTFADKTTDPIEITNGTISGTQVRIMNNFSLMVTGDYYFNKDAREIRPYAGLGVGMNYIDQRWDLGIYSFNTYNWHFSLAPEIGALIPLGDVDGIIGATYMYSFDSGQTAWGADDNTQQYLVFKIGLVWTRF
jgi:hypothetical protein